MSRRMFVACVLVVAAAWMANSAAGAALSWDPTATGSAAGGGAGTWDTGSWWNGAGDVGWVTGDNASFGGSTAGIVNILNGVSANNLVFNTAGYTVSGNSLTLTGGTVNAKANATISSLVAGTAGLTVVGPGTVTLNGPAANTYTGGTTVNGGGLLLDFSNMSSPTNLVPGNALTLIGGNLGVNGNLSTATSQGFSSATASTGANFLDFNLNSAATVNASLGALSRTNSGTLDVTLPSLGTVAQPSGNLNISNSAILDSVYSDFMTVNGGQDWAAVSNGQIVPGSSVSGFYLNNAVNNQFNCHTNITTAETLTTAGNQTGDVYFSNTGSLTLTLTGNLAINCGGILATPFVTDTITGGSLQCNGTPKTLEVFDYGSLTINSRIVNYSSSKNNLIVTGSGNTTLANNSNGFTGNLVIDGGTTTVNSQVNSNVKLSTMGSATSNSRDITVNDGATLYWNTNNALISGSGPNASTAPTIQLNGSTLFATNYNAIGYVQLNGGTLTQNVNSTGSYQGYDFLGTITVTGSSSSLISAFGRGRRPPRVGRQRRNHV